MTDMIFEEGMLSRAVEIIGVSSTIAEASIRFICSAIAGTRHATQIYFIMSLKFKTLDVFSLLVSRAQQCLIQIENPASVSTFHDLYRALIVLFNMENDIYAKRSFESEQLVDVMYDCMVRYESYDIQIQAGI